MISDSSTAMMKFFEVVESYYPQCVLSYDNLGILYIECDGFHDSVYVSQFECMGDLIEYILFRIGEYYED